MTCIPAVTEKPARTTLLRIRSLAKAFALGTPADVASVWVGGRVLAAAPAPTAR